ncbi:MAG: JAB domain-containing protein [Butyricicoccus sp.]
MDSYKIARGALMAGAAGVAPAHNHPNGTPTPSQEDFDMTDRLQRTLSELGLSRLITALWHAAISHLSVD